MASGPSQSLTDQPSRSADLTTGPIFGHLLRMAIPIAIGLLFQNLYHLIDLYFVAQLGDAAIAGVSAAGNLMFMVLAASQALSAEIDKRDRRIAELEARLERLEAALLRSDANAH